MKCTKCNSELPDTAIYCMNCGKKLISEPRKRKKRTNGAGSISKLSGKRAKPYLARINGISIGTFKTVAEAEKELARLTDHQIEDNFNLTFAEVYNRWRPEHEKVLYAKAVLRGVQDGKTSGMEGYASAYKNCTELHDKVFRSIHRTDLQAVIDRIRDSGRSAAVAEKVKQLFGQLYKYAISEHICLSNLAPSVVIISGKKKPKKTFTAEEIRKLEKSTNPAAQIALLLIATGGRINEVFSVATSDCYDEYFIGGNKTSAGMERIIPVAPVGISAYKSLLSIAREKKLRRLIDAYEGNHNSANYRKRDYYPLLDELGISREKTPHCSRHTYTTLAVSAGVKPEDLTKMLGHTGYSTTIENYDNPDADRLVRAASKIKVETG